MKGLQNRYKTSNSRIKVGKQLSQTFLMTKRIVTGMLHIANIVQNIGRRSSLTMEKKDLKKRLTFAHFRKKR